MFTEERREEIISMLHKNGAVSVSGLTEHFSVSVETIRRDFLELEKIGLLKRVHGGAIIINQTKKYLNLDARERDNKDKKTELSRNAMFCIHEGDVIGIDAGSTANVFADMLTEHFSDLTVVTHSLDVFNRICHHKNFKVILCSGHFSKEENAFYGPLCKEVLKKLHMQKAFIFPSAVSIRGGVCDYNETLSEIQKIYVENSDSIYVLADSSKYEKNALLKITDMLPQYTYITDSKLSEDLKKMYKENQMTVISNREDLL